MELQFTTTEAHDAALTKLLAEAKTGQTLEEFAAAQIKSQFDGFVKQQKKANLENTKRELDAVAEMLSEQDLNTVLQVAQKYQAQAP